MIQINIAHDFSDTPGGRYISEGEYSGEQFRNNILLPKYEYAEQHNEKLEINFDGCWGFGTSFLEEAFGGLVRLLKKKGILSRIILVSMEDETIPDNVKKYVREAEEKI